MELELEPRVKPLAFKVKAMSRESPSQKAANVLDSDLRTHWSTGTNTKEWILLELDEPCLLSHIRIYNKSVLEWEITAGLRYKPETFVKVRPRCEAPRRDMFYPMNYTACRYIRISCLRGNPIAIFFIQLIGVSVVGLEPEFQPIISYLLPHIVSHKEDVPDLHLQLLQDISKKLSVFLPQLENDLNSFSDAADLKIRFFAMLVGPFYPVLHLVNQRALTASIDPDSLQNRISSGLTISSNFEVQPRRSRSPLPPNQTACNSIVFRSESVFILLRKAYENSHLGTVCLIASRALQILLQPIIPTEETIKSGDSSTSLKEGHIKSELASCFSLNDYSGLFGEDFRIYDDHSDGSCTNLLDIFAVEEAILHFLYAAASEPMVCHTLAENVEELWSLLPLIQALLPALRPPSNDIVEQVDETFSQWKIPLVQRALAQIASVSSSMASRSLLRASAGYLLSFQQSQARAACMLIDLHFGPFAPWTSSLVMKIDLAVELLEGLLNAIQLASQSTSRARAALKYVILGLSGHMDDVLAGYKEVKHKVLFLVEMLEPFLDPAISTSKAVIKFGDVPATVSEKQKRSCDIALNVIRTAVGRAAVLPSLESEWRLGTVSPSVLLSILGPHMTLPDEIDCCKCTVENIADAKVLPVSASFCHRTGQLNESDLRFEPESLTKTEVCDDGILLFAPVELRNMNLTYSRFPEGITVNKNSLPPAESNLSEKQSNKFPAEALESSRYLVGVSPNKDLKFCTDYLQLMHLDAAAKRASEFKRLAFDLHLQVNATPEGHSAAVDALLLAAECYVNPLFSTTFGNDPHHLDQLITSGPHIQDRQKDSSLTFRNYRRTNNGLESLMQHETKRDKIVLELLLKSAKWESEYHKSTTDDHLPESENFGQGVEMSVEDMDSADAVTLLRQNQALLCHFLVTRLLSGQQCRHEVLLQALSFYLQTATELFCPPEDIVEIILRHAEDFNGFVTSFYHEVTNYSDKFDREKLSYRIHRRWDLLQNLVIASSRSDIGLNCRNILNVFHYGSLVPLVSWIWKMPAFSSSPFPLVRYVGWMAISNFAKQYTKEQLFFSSDLSSITNLLSIFVDELALIDDIVTQKPGATNSEKLLMENRCDFSDDLCVQGFRNTPHVDLHMFIPDLKLQFKYFAEHILEAVSLQLETIPSVAISDVLTWFSGFCLAPFSRKKRYECRIEDSDKSLTGNAGKNLKAIILHLLKSIVSAHMDAIVPEMPQVAQILISLCKVSYCDVDFLDSVLRVLDPLICYSLAKASEGHGSLVSHTFCDDFENACFQEIFDHVGGLVEGTDISMETYQGPLIIFLLGTLFSYLSTQRKRAILRFVTSWADFNLLASTSYLDYLKAFENFFNNCNMLIVQSLKLFDVFVPDELQAKEAAVTPKDSEESPLSTFSDSHTPKSRKVLLSLKDMGDISQLLDELFLKIFPSVESCWMLHSQFAHKITVVLGKSYLLKACMISLSSSVDKDGGKNSNDMHFVVSDHLKTAVEGFVMKILALQKDHCWQIASTMLDFLFGLPDIIPLNHVICSICSEIKEFCCRAPRISWRLQSDKWLSLLFNRVRPLCDEESTLLDLFCTMLGHTEPEQRAVALRHLGALVGLDINNGVFKLSYGDFQTEVSSVLCSDTSDKTVFVLVSGLWDKVATLASTDPLLLLRASAIALLSGFIPFTERSQLQSLFASFDSIFPGTGQQICPNQKPLMFLSFSLLARACIYSSKEDILLLPENVWSCLESIAKSNSGVRNMEKKMCEALCGLRNKDGDANEMLTKAFPPTSVGQSDPDFESTRGSLLEVLSTVTSMQSYMDFFSKKLDGEAQELEEAEIELELLMKENASVEAQKIPLKESSILKCQGHLKPSDYIVKLRHEIRELEKGRLRVEVANRRQKKLLAQHTRQKYLEEAASREMELLQELDRERTYEAEREIERQKLLEVERAKTRELRHNLELERERQTQRELQKELEQAESGVQVSRREFPSHTGSGRTRERYRDRDSGRVSNEGSVRSNSRGRENTQASASGPQMPTLVLSGSSRSFSGSVPTILQVRDRSDERGTSYEESFDGSRDSGDTGSVGDPDPASGFDGLSGGFGSGVRQGSRGGKSRQIVERREREGRREGKWERKHA